MVLTADTPNCVLWAHPQHGTKLVWLKMTSPRGEKPDKFVNRTKPHWPDLSNKASASDEICMTVKLVIIVSFPICSPNSLYHGWTDGRVIVLQGINLSHCTITFCLCVRGSTSVILPSLFQLISFFVCLSFLYPAPSSRPPSWYPSL